MDTQIIEQSTEEPKRHTMPAKQDEVRRLRVLSKDGTQIPPCTPVNTYATQRDYDMARGYGLPARSPYSCPDCREGHPASTCTGHCVSLSRFFERRVQTQKEFELSEMERRDKSK
jgi:hypothetical protein